MPVLKKTRADGSKSQPLTGNPQAELIYGLLGDLYEIAVVKWHQRTGPQTVFSANSAPVLGQWTSECPWRSSPLEIWAQIQLWPKKKGACCSQPILPREGRLHEHHKRYQAARYNLLQLAASAQDWNGGRHQLSSGRYVHRSASAPGVLAELRAGSLHSTCQHTAWLQPVLSAPEAAIAYWYIS